MANFVPKQNETYMSGTSFRTLLSFSPLLPESVRAEAYADVVTKFSRMNRLRNYLGNGALVARFAHLELCTNYLVI